MSSPFAVRSTPSPLQPSDSTSNDTSKSRRPLSTFVIDLAGVTFLDSSALGAIVGALRLLRARGSALRVVEPQGATARIFSQTGLDAVLALYPTRESALSAEIG